MQAKKWATPATKNSPILTNFEKDFYFSSIFGSNGVD
jgi:hypothetical protein